jgi:transcriptional antiterminator RfaH
MQEESEKPWYILNVKPNQELMAEVQLKKLGIEVYVPLYYKTVKKNKEKVKIIKPLFSGYIFARFDLIKYYHKIIYTKGIKSVLGNTSSIWFLDNNKVEEIKKREKDGIIVLKKKNEKFSRGDRVLIDEGSFDGWEGIFYEELPEKDRVVILLTSLGFSSKMTVPRDILIKKS